MRINATPSDLPLMSAGRAIYPVPPQRGQSLGSTRPPQLLTSLSPIRVRSTGKLILLRNANNIRSAPANRAWANMFGDSKIGTRSGACSVFSPIVRASRPPNYLGKRLSGSLKRHCFQALPVLFFRVSKTGADSSSDAYLRQGQVFLYNPGIVMLKD